MADQGQRGERGPQGDHGQDGQDGQDGAKGPRGEPGKREEGNPFVMVGSLAQNVRFVAAMFLLLATAGLLFQVVDNRKDDEKLLSIAQEAVDQREILLEQSDRIVDCTEPGGECFDEGQKRTAEAVGSINIVTQFSVICGESQDGEEAILECVNESVKAYLKKQESNGG